LYAAASCWKLGEDARLIGTFFPLRQSVKLAVPVDEGDDEGVEAVLVVELDTVEELDTGPEPQVPNPD
jgi:hypothetical protein